MPPITPNDKVAEQQLYVRARAAADAIEAGHDITPALQREWARLPEQSRQLAAYWQFCEVMDEQSRPPLPRHLFNADDTPITNQETS